MLRTIITPRRVIVTRGGGYGVEESTQPPASWGVCFMGYYGGDEIKVMAWAVRVARMVRNEKYLKTLVGNLKGRQHLTLCIS